MLVINDTKVVDQNNGTFAVEVNNGKYEYMRHFKDENDANVVALNLLFKGEFHFMGFKRMEVAA